MVALQGDLIINLSFVGNKPTGLANYATNLIPELEIADRVLLSSQPRNGYSFYKIPDCLTPEQGKKGHFDRLVWTQFQLPKIHQELKAKLLFSPIPEAPLFSNCDAIVTVHDLIPLRFQNWSSPLTYYFRYYVPQVLKQAKHILCNSIATAQEITHFFDISADKITPIPLACDRGHFQFLNLPTQNYFLHLGRHDPHKNVQRILAAFAQLPDVLNYELWFVGSSDDRYTPALIEQAKELGIKTQIKFLDYISYAELPKVINGAIALIFPSLWEGFGFPVLEAMSCGTPVITSNLSALPEVAGEAALLVNPYHVEEIASAMRMVCVDEGARSQLRQAGLERANHFSWKKTGQETTEVLKRFL